MTDEAASLLARLQSRLDPLGFHRDERDIAVPGIAIDAVFRRRTLLVNRAVAVVRAVA